jgi:hypothetical protein
VFLPEDDLVEDRQNDRLMGVSRPGRIFLPKFDLLNTFNNVVRVFSTRFERKPTRMADSGLPRVVFSPEDDLGEIRQNDRPMGVSRPERIFFPESDSLDTFSDVGRSFCTNFESQQTPMADIGFPQAFVSARDDFGCDFDLDGHDFADDSNYLADDEDEALMADDPTPGANGCVDSGASAHYVPHTAFFLSRLLPGSKTDFRSVIYTAGPQPLRGEVKASFVLKDPTFGVPLVLKNVMLVHGLRRPLISVPILCAEGYVVVFAGSRCIFLTPGSNEGCLLLDRRSDGGLSSLFEVPLSYFDDDFEKVAALAQTYAGPDSFVTWHRRLGHLNPLKMAKTLSDQLSAKECTSACACHACIAAKIHHTAYPKTSAFSAPFPGHSTSLDFAGPFRVQSPFGERYFLLFIDVCTRFKSIRLAKRKDQLDQFVLEHIARVERTQQPRRVCSLISDGALCSNEVRRKLRQLGITVLIIAPGASRLNLVERGNHTI